MKNNIVYNNITFNFEKKNILVVGGSRGIGLGVVKAFANAGAMVFYISRSPLIESSIKKIVHIPVDLSNEEEIKKVFNIIDDYGGIDILINSAAINYINKFEKISSKEWDDVLKINLKSVFLLSQSALIRMKKNNAGKIVNISSIAGRHRSYVSGAHYVASKAGLIGLTKQLAYEVAEFNININAVCPSQTMTDLLLESMNQKEQKELIKNIPIKRLATVNDQVGPILFLCSDAASYITGTYIDINGGQI